ncbi:hypothetical protein ABKN59_003739 [Abortiporus biennis]
MSNPLIPTTINGIIHAFSVYTRANELNVATRTLFIWDYLITFDREVGYFWGKRLSVVSLLFFVNRYVNLFAVIIELFLQARFNTLQVSIKFVLYHFVFAPLTFNMIINRGSLISFFLGSFIERVHRSCKILTRLDEALILCSLLVIAAFVTLRIYATWTRDWRPALPVLILALAPFGSMVYLYSHATPILAPKFIGGCAMTLRLNTRPRLVTLLLRDGSIYFSLLLLMNVTQLGLSTKIQANVASPYFVPPITSILMSRFLLNLRRVHLSPSDPDLPNSISSSGQFTSIGAKEVVSTVQFSTAFLGNMAAPLHYSLSSSTTGSRSSAEIWDEPLLAGLVPVEVDHELEVIA